MDIALVWTLTASLVLVGLAGVVVPLLPGTTLILIAMIVHKLLLPDALSWAIIGWGGTIWIVSVMVDFVGVILGTRLFGGSKWGMTGAGALIGMFFSLPALLLGTFAGAAAAEKFIARKTVRDSLRAGVGATAGFLLSTVGRLACAVGIIALFLFATLGRA